MDHVRRTLTARSFAAVAALPEEHQDAALACVDAGRTEALDNPDALVVTLDVGAHPAQLERAIGMIRGVCAVHPTRASWRLDEALEAAERLCARLGLKETGERIQIILDAFDAVAREAP